MSSSNTKNKNILKVDDDVNTSSKYKKWLRRGRMLCAKKRC